MGSLDSPEKRRRNIIARHLDTVPPVELFFKLGSGAAVLVAANGSGNFDTQKLIESDLAIADRLPEDQPLQVFHFGCGGGSQQRTEADTQQGDRSVTELPGIVCCGDDIPDPLLPVGFYKLALAVTGTEWVNG